MDLTYIPATKELMDRLEELELSLLIRVITLADAVANDVVNHAKSNTSKTKPGVNPGDGQRKVHPGNWGDITSNLANSIEYEIKTNGLEVKAIVKATMEYAAALDAKTGYSVLGGVEQVARRSIKKHANKYF